MKFDGHLLGPLYLVDGVRDVIVLDIGFVGRIIEYQRVVFQGVVHPFFEFFLADHRACGVVGIAQVDDIHTAVGYLGHKAVFLRTRHIGHIAPFAVGLAARPSTHDVRVDVNGIDGVGDTDAVVPAHQLADVAGIALGTIVDKDFAGVEVYASGQKIVLHDGLTQKQIALFGTVAMKTFLHRHVVHGLVHGLDDSGTQRPCHIAYAEADDV